MTTIVTFLLLALVQLQLSSAFAPLRTRAMMKPMAAIDFNSLMVAAVEVVEQAEDYKYGAVAAPSWALPLGAVLVIFTAAIPILLKPGQDVRRRGIFLDTLYDMAILSSLSLFIPGDR